MRQAFQAFPHPLALHQQLEETVASPRPTPPPFTLRQRQADPTLRSKRDVAPACFPRALDAHIVSAPIASGGMASVHLAASADPRHDIVAVKRLHPHLATDPSFTQMLLDEAAIAVRVRHRNVVTMYGADVIGTEVVLVMEYVPGLPLHVVMQKLYPGRAPARLAAAIIAATLRGLDAAHDARDANNRPLRIVHRDVSPQNILVGRDGVTRILDFGVAKAEQRYHRTQAGDVKGKLAYMSPEQLRGASVDRRTDVYAAAVVLWEILVGAPLFRGGSDGNTVAKVLEGSVTPPGAEVPGIPAALDAIVMRGLAARRDDRFATAREMADALDGVFASEPVRRSELRTWVRELGGDALRKQAQTAADLRRRATPSMAPMQPPAMHAPPGMQAPPATVIVPLHAASPLPAPMLPLALDALRGRVAIFAAIFVTALACGVATEGVVASAFHRQSDTPSEPTADESR
ncbi:MAG: eukaryotic-like serine/threonine-protein kinase [Myxococcales bacterium]|nr:eukaryotic-like serine/threonine-protein kinase [Myxococcales bacterium]